MSPTGDRTAILHGHPSYAKPDLSVCMQGKGGTLTSFLSPFVRL